MSVKLTEKWGVSPTPTPPHKKENIQIVRLKHGETSGYKNIYLFIYLFGSDVTYNI